MEEEILVKCAKEVDKRTVKSAYLLILSKIRESERIGKNTDSSEIFSDILAVAAKRVRTSLFEKDWDTAKEAAEALKAMFKTISICYAEIGYGVPSELCEIFDGAMEEFREKIDSVDRKVAKVFKLAEYRKT